MLPKISSASKGETNNTQGNRSCKKKRLQKFQRTWSTFFFFFCNSLKHAWKILPEKSLM